MTVNEPSRAAAMSRRCRLVALAAGVGLAASLAAPGRAAPPAAPSRGELLYANHCVACHTVQMHWRERRLVTDWATLKAQVQRWQAVNELPWSDDDVLEVTRYLNDAVYRFPLKPLG